MAYGTISHHRFIIGELDNANSIHAFNRFEEKRHVELLSAILALLIFHVMSFMPWLCRPIMNKIFHDLTEVMKKLMPTLLMWVNTS